MKAMALGHTFAEARRLADAIMLQLVLLCTLLGYRIVRTDEEGWLLEHVFFRVCQVSSRDICGLVPAIAGTAGNNSRTFLQA
jgi:hypothetical protein